jgi:hypothetical protein
MYPTPPEARLRQLAREYANLRNLVGYDPASRGRRFNWWLAEVFQAWGHRARADTQENGNIDVAFAIRDARFVLEAKWEQHRTPIDPVAKLQKRVLQRLGGTIGVFVSMAGYTASALHDLKDGQRLEVVLLTREHVEAMLTGFCPPYELFELLLDHAHFDGVPTRPLYELLADTSERALPAIGHRSEAEPVLSSAAGGVTATWIAAGSLPFGQSGLTLCADGRVIAVTDTGLLAIDPIASTCEWMVAPTKLTDAKALPGGDIAIVRRSGVARLGAAGLQILDGPFAGRVRFTRDCYGVDDIAVWSNDALGTGPDGEQRGLLAYLGTAPGESRTVEVTGAGSGTSGAARLSADTTLVLGNPSVLLDPTGAHKVELPVSNAASACALGDDIVIAGGDITLLRANRSCRDFAELATLNLRGSVVDVVARRGSHGPVYVMAATSGAQSMSIAQLDLSGSSRSRRTA